MEYGTDLYQEFKVSNPNNEIGKKCDYNQLFDNNYYRYVGYKTTEYPGNPVQKLFSQLVLNQTQKKITNLLKKKMTKKLYNFWKFLWHKEIYI